MMKFYLATFLTAFALLFVASVGRSQTAKNAFVVNLGVASEGYGYPNGLTFTANSGIPTLGLSGEYSISKLIGLGMYGAYTYSFYKNTYPGTGYKDVWRGWDIGIKSTFHVGELFLKNEKTDLYLSAFSGYTTRSLVYDKSNVYRESLNYNVNAISVGGIIGFQYLFTPITGLYVEAGASRRFFIDGGISFHIHAKK